MGLSIQRLRWLLLVGAVLLVAVLAGFIAIGRWRAHNAYLRIMRQAGVHVTHDTNGFTYSQTVQGRTIFTLHAKKATQLADGKWALHDAWIALYSRMPDRPDYIYGSEVEYDEHDGVARAQGEVHMDLQAPDALTDDHAGVQRPAPAAIDPMQHDRNEAIADRAGDTHVIHVKTSGLVYLRRLGVAATDQPVEFEYNGLHATARGAEFNTGQNVLRLLADVVMDDTLHGHPVHGTAAQAEFDRAQNLALLTSPVVSSQGRTARADNALLNLQKNGAIQRVHGTGNVVLSEATTTVRAPRLDLILNDEMQLSAAHLTGGVLLADSDSLRPAQGSAARVDASFDAQGQPLEAHATGEVHLRMLDRRAQATGHGRSVVAQEPSVGLERTLAAAEVVGIFAASPRSAVAGRQQRMLTSLEAKGQAHARSESLVKGSPGGAKKALEVSADDLLLHLVMAADGREHPDHLTGTGHTLLVQQAPRGELESSAGDMLEASFAARQNATRPNIPVRAPDAAATELTIREATQRGHVTIHQQAAMTAQGKPGAASFGTAQQAVYRDLVDSGDPASSAAKDSGDAQVGSAAQLVLTGEVHWQSDRAQLIAPSVTVKTASQDVFATGGVATTIFGAGTDVATDAAAHASSGRQAGDDAVTHILSASASLHHASQQAEFRGTDAQPAKMWQQGSQVQAATLLFDGVARTLQARPAASGAMVHAVLVGTPSARPGPHGPRAATVLRVVSPAMDYDDHARQAVFQGGVTMEGSLGDAHSQRVTVYLQPALHEAASGGAGSASAQSPAFDPHLGGSLDHVILSGDVVLQQPGRRATGDALLYTAASGQYLLTGTSAHPPLVVDAQQGSVTGSSLLFGDAGSTIVVSGDAGKGKPGVRVRTETVIKP